MSDEHNKLRRIWMAEAGGISGNGMSYHEWLLEQLLLTSMVTVHKDGPSTKWAQAKLSVDRALDRAVREAEERKRVRDEELNRDA